MRFNPPPLQASVFNLLRHKDDAERCIGENYLWEENVSPKRQAHFEDWVNGESDIKTAANSYFEQSIQGISRGHRPSTFDPDLNAAALLPASIEPNQKIVRLERIDSLIEGDLDFSRLRDALDGRTNPAVLQTLIGKFEDFPGERPSFAAFRSEVADILRDATGWLPHLIARLGLYHYYPEGVTYSFALMEYTAKDVLDHAKTIALRQPFALATVLECRNSPAFCPVPRGSKHGFAVNLSDADHPATREILHCRIAYQPCHLRQLAQWTGAPLPAIVDCRRRHLERLRQTSGRGDFGRLDGLEAGT